MPFFMIDHDIFKNFKKSTLGGNEYFVYSAILMHKNNKTEKAWPGLATIAEITGLSKTTIIRAIKKLENSGYIEIQRTNNKPNVYTVVSKLNQRGTDLIPEGYNSDTTGVSKMDTGGSNLTPELYELTRRKELQPTNYSDKNDIEKNANIEKSENELYEGFGGFLDEERKENLTQRFAHSGLDMIAFESVTLLEKVWLIAKHCSLSTESFPQTFDFDTVEEPELLLYWWSQKIQEKDHETKRNRIKSPAKWLSKAIDGNWQPENVYREEFNKIKVRVENKKDKKVYQKCMRILSDQFTNDTAMKLLNEWHDHYKYHEDAKKRICNIVQSGAYKNGLEAIKPPKKEEIIKTDRSLIGEYKEHFYASADNIEPLEARNG